MLHAFTATYFSLSGMQGKDTQACNTFTLQMWWMCSRHCSNTFIALQSTCYSAESPSFGCCAWYFDPNFSYILFILTFLVILLLRIQPAFRIYCWFKNSMNLFCCRHGVWCCSIPSVSEGCEGVVSLPFRILVITSLIFHRF